MSWSSTAGGSDVESLGLEPPSCLEYSCLEAVLLSLEDFVLFCYSLAFSAAFLQQSASTAFAAVDEYFLKTSLAGVDVISGPTLVHHCSAIQCQHNYLSMTLFDHG